MENVLKLSECCDLNSIWPSLKRLSLEKRSKIIIMRCCFGIAKGLGDRLSPIGYH